jgi:2-amino-4-hydroxy-6-hydroxymethyldihydropteridine diphosphokinase
LDRIFIGLGANLPSPAGEPPATIAAAMAEFARLGVAVRRRSRLWRSAPVPPSDQPWYINAVAEVATSLTAPKLLELLQKVERKFGRVRGETGAARTLDLDVLDYGGEKRSDPPPILPHPRMAERAFVLYPLAEIAPGWRHPASGKTLHALISALPPDQKIEPILDERP